MAEENPVSSSLGSALQTAGEVGKFALKKGVDAGLAALSGGTSKAIQLGVKALRGLKKASQITGAVRQSEDNKTTLFLILGFGALFFLIIVLIIIIPAAFVAKSVEKLKIPFADSSDYIAVSKVVNPSNIKNEELPREFAYIIAISAIKEKITNVQITDSFKYYQGGNQKSFTPFKKEVQGSIMLPQKIDEIRVGEPKIYGYKIALDESFKDSLVVNEIWVKGNMGPFTKEIKTYAAIIIGSSPGCFSFSDSKDKWSDSEKSQVTEAVAKILSSPGYSQNLCQKGPIELIRERKNDYAHADSRNSKIYLTNGSSGGTFNSQEVILYTLSHESGHIFANRNSYIYNKFFRNLFNPFGGQQEDYICSYPLKKTPDEDFPETIAVFIMNKFYPNYPYVHCGNKPINLQTDYPKHYNFCINNIF